MATKEINFETDQDSQQIQRITFIKSFDGFISIQIYRTNQSLGLIFNTSCKSDAKGWCYQSIGAMVSIALGED